MRVVALVFMLFWVNHVCASSDSSFDPLTVTKATLTEHLNPQTKITDKGLQQMWEEDLKGLTPLQRIGSLEFFLRYEIFQPDFSQKLLLALNQTLCEMLLKAKPADAVLAWNLSIHFNNLAKFKLFEPKSHNSFFMGAVAFTSALLSVAPEPESTDSQKIVDMLLDSFTALIETAVVIWNKLDSSQRDTCLKTLVSIVFKKPGSEHANLSQWRVYFYQTMKPCVE